VEISWSIENKVIVRFVLGRIENRTYWEPCITAVISSSFIIRHRGQLCEGTIDRIQLACQLEKGYAGVVINSTTKHDAGTYYADIRLQGNPTSEPRQYAEINISTLSLGE
jgi:hypothetical protein